MAKTGKVRRVKMTLAQVYPPKYIPWGFKGEWLNRYLLARRVGRDDRFSRRVARQHVGQLLYEASLPVPRWARFW